jgi:hypothetical protein
MRVVVARILLLISSSQLKLKSSAFSRSQNRKPNAGIASVSARLMIVYLVPVVTSQGIPPIRNIHPITFALNVKVIRYINIQVIPDTIVANLVKLIIILISLPFMAVSYPL